MERREGRACRPLVRFVAGDECPVGVGGQDLLRREMARGERRLAGAGGPDEDHQAGIGDDDDAHGPMMRHATAVIAPLPGAGDPSANVARYEAERLTS